MFKIKKIVGAAALALAASAAANATTISLTGADYNTWQAFDVDDFVGPNFSSAWIDGHTDAAGSRYKGNGSVLSFAFTLAGAAQLRVVDSGFIGDRFSLSDNGVALALTSVAGAFDDTFALGATQAQLDQAFADVRFSKATYLLAAGNHTITGALDSTSAPFISTVGGLMITPVPEPGAFALLLAGLCLLGTIARRRA